MRRLSNLVQHKTSRFLLAVSLLIAALASFAAPALTPYSAEYKIEISIVNGKLNTLLHRTETGYVAESVIKATGLSRLFVAGSIRETSWFSEGEGSIQPHQYRSTDGLSSDHDTIDLNFDWHSNEVTGLIDGEEFQAALEGEVHDRVSLQYGLMYDLLNGGEKKEYFLQDAEELKVLSITNIGSKAVKVPFGNYNAVGIQHQRMGSSRITTLWCVEELGYLPVIIEQHRKGKLRLRAVLTKYDPIVDSMANSTAQQESR